MTVGMLTADWFLLSRDLYFRKFEVYPMDWHQEVNMDNVIAVTSQYGGPIAIKRDKYKIVKVQGTGQPIISIYSGSGHHITSIKCEGKSLIKVGWSNQENLVLVQEDGKVTIHNIFTNFAHTFSITHDLQDTRLIDAIIFNNINNLTGIAVMTTKFRIYVVNNIYEPRTRQFSELPRSTIPPTCWDVIAQETVEVLVARERDLFRLKLDEPHANTMFVPDIKHNHTSIISMTVSFNARHLALFTDAGYVWLGSSDFRTRYEEINTNIIYKPKQLVWCGNEAVIAFWEQDNTLMIIGRRDCELITFTYDSCVHLAPEVDCVRILSTMQHEIVQKVPDVVQKIFRINSTDPGSFLLEASKQFQKRSHRADEYICLVKNNLDKAVMQCIEAAGYEFDTDIQKMLIRAAQFGKCFISDIDSDEYVKMCRLLRVLNAVRHRRIGIPLTYMQLQFLTNQNLLDRLVARKHYYLAIQIAKYLKLPESEGSNRILVHWAKYKVSKREPMNDELIAKAIYEKLGTNPAISYSDIAKTAADNGRKEIAIKLLDFESKASEQVKLLVHLEEHQPALVKAIESGDTDLIYDVILKLRNDMPLADFKLLIHKYPISLALYKKYCREHNAEALHEIFIQEDDFNAQAEQYLTASLNEKKIFERETCIQSALDAYKKGRNDLNASLCDEALHLLRHQRTFEEKLRKTFLGMSVHETCKQLLMMNELKLAEKFKAEYKIPDKRYWWLRIETLAALQKWDELEKFSKLKKSPIGYAPFVDVCLLRHNRDEALKYLTRVNPEIKVKYYVKAHELDEAAQIAFEQKDLQGLYSIQSRCTESALNEKINAFITQLGVRK